MAQELNQYRLVWRDLETGLVCKGTFLFDEPTQAVDTHAAARSVMPRCEFWLEDKHGRRVEIPRAGGRRARRVYR